MLILQKVVDKPKNKAYNKRKKQKKRGEKKMTREEMIEKIKEEELRKWEELYEARKKYGETNNETVEIIRAEWATIYRLMISLRIETK